MIRVVLLILFVLSVNYRQLISRVDLLNRLIPLSYVQRSGQTSYVTPSIVMSNAESLSNAFFANFELLIAFISLYLVICCVLYCSCLSIYITIIKHSLKKVHKNKRAIEQTISMADLYYTDMLKIFDLYLYYT